MPRERFGCLPARACGLLRGEHAGHCSRARKAASRFPAGAAAGSGAGGHGVAGRHRWRNAGVAGLGLGGPGIPVLPGLRASGDDRGRCVLRELRGRASRGRRSGARRPVPGTAACPASGGGRPGPGPSGVSRDPRFFDAASEALWLPCFYVTTHRPYWLWGGQAAYPLMVSYRTLRRVRRTGRAAVPGWALDSGAFMELSRHGRWTISSREYIAAVAGDDRDVGLLEWSRPRRDVRARHYPRRPGQPRGHRAGHQPVRRRAPAGRRGIGEPGNSAADPRLRSSAAISRSTCSSSSRASSILTSAARRRRSKTSFRNSRAYTCAASRRCRGSCQITGMPLDAARPARRTWPRPSCRRSIMWHSSTVLPLPGTGAARVAISGVGRPSG